MIQYAENKHRPELRRLWECCFPADSAQFLDYYFEHIFRPDETLLYLHDHKPAASLQMMPYQLKVGDSSCNACYFYGIMTRPELRRNGYMGRLLTAAFDEMRKRAIDVSFLIPQESWLFEIYEKFGYRRAFPVFPFKKLPFHRVFADVTVAEQTATAIAVYTEFHESAAQALFPLYTRFLTQKTHVVLKNFRQFSDLLRVFFMEGGTLFTECKNDFAFCLRDENGIRIKESYFSAPTERDRYLSFIADYFSTDELLMSDSGMSANFTFYGMIKALDPQFAIPENIYMSMMLD
ncbi:MAG: GNAT family N-acetyltransferase [Dysgonamonadaceae bacterium]|jgi:GNAT superfamily N-acetyltransferase|nr:GNAT family N-acetyltransferase [Dysgonamonadaceae bacterium]